MNIFDSNTRKFLLVCSICFLTAVALKLNGSSIFIWKEFLKDRNSYFSLILSTPKDDRSDEWEVWTPAVISQATLKPSFPTENPSLGSGKVPLIYNLPVRYYTMLFRPQFYGFFVFNLETAYSFYWNCKIFGLLISMFLLFQFLTKNNLLLSLFGTLWLFFSSYIQWWFSCPPMLPEMLASWAFAILCVIQLFASKGKGARILASLGLIFSGMNFVLCLYPPFQIPLLCLGALIVIGYLLENKSASDRPGYRIGAGYLAILLIVIIALLVPFFLDCKETFRALSETSYPGHRRCNGGALTVLKLFSGVMNPFNTDARYPDMYAQANVAANFYPLWIAASFVIGYAFYKTRRFRPTILCLLAGLVVISLYAVIGLPAWFCKITLLSFCTEERCLLPIGIANIFLTVLTLNEVRMGSIKFTRRFVAGSLAVLSFALIAYFIFAARFNPKFLTLTSTVMLLAVNLSFLALFFKAPARIFCTVLVGIFAVTNGLVNPIMTGLSPLLRATPRKAIREMANLHPDAKWLAFGDNVLSEFLMAMGVNTLSGVKIVPNLDLYQKIDPAGKWKPIYNRYSFANYYPSSDRNAVSIHYVGFPTHLIYIHPDNQALRDFGVKYVVFRRLVPGAANEGLKLVQAFPLNQIWIYELTDWAAAK